MATNKRTYPNDYFVYYNDDNRLAILCQDTTSTDNSTSDKYDTFQGAGNLSGTISDADCSGTTITFTCSADHGLVTGDRVSISGTTNFNDDNLASQSVTVTNVNTFTMTRSSSSSATNETGTFSSLFVDNGIRITYHSKYEEATATGNNLQSDLGLDSALHNAVVCYVKARLYENDEDFQFADYFRKMYEAKVKKFRSRRSAVRVLSVPRL
tara:strand:- start:4719 stop:5351 length:633 start_codon:yes stop_codon:yes gene_type:complete